MTRSKSFAALAIAITTSSRLTRRTSVEKVGDLMVELRGVNVKKNQYTVAIYVDDSRYEKKNRSANEPIYFFTHGSRVPLEFVVNSVGKDKITGYLSVPKTATTTHSGFRQLD